MIHNDPAVTLSRRRTRAVIEDLDVRSRPRQG